MADNTLQYLSGRGWLVFSGGHTAGSPIRAQALARSKTYGSTAYISLADDSGDALMDDMEDLGARSGYFVDLEFDKPEDIVEQLQTASLIVVEVGSSVDALYSALQGAALEGIREAYQRGALILLEVLTVNLFGRYTLSDGGELLDGFDWVQNTFIEPQSTGLEDSRAVQLVLANIPNAIAVNIAAGSALCLGENGLVEIWGDNREVTISLGRSYAESD
jgi:hypothetical protein